MRSTNLHAVEWIALTHADVPYSSDFDQRRRTSLLWHGLAAAGWLAALLIRAVPWYVPLGILVAYAAVVGVPYALVWRARATERRARKTGGEPSWPAMVPCTAIRPQVVAAGGRVVDVGTVGGRLQVSPAAFQWRPSNRTRRILKFEAPLTWSRPEWQADLRRTWGIGDPGWLSLSNRRGDIVELWVRDRRDLQRHLEGPESN